MIDKLNIIVNLIGEYDQLYDLKDIDAEYLNIIRDKISEINPFEDKINDLLQQLESANDTNLLPLLIELRAVMISMADLFEEINDIKWRILSNLPDENEK